MRIIMLLATLLGVCSLHAQNTNLKQGWDALSKNDRAAAESFFQKAMQDAATKQDAFISNLYLQTYNGKQKGVTDFTENFYQSAPNPYPYIYALWFNDAVLGSYGKKKYNHQLSLAEALQKDAKAPGTINAGASYHRGLHLLFSNEFAKANGQYDQINSIKNWQYVGPFENISETGIYKDYGPLDHPEPDAVFYSISHAPVKWFTPPSENNDGWIPVTYQVPRRTCVVYAQTFVESDKDQQVNCAVGFTGAVKVWINDAPVITETRELVTELDAYSAKANLKKGLNRVLVQLAYSDRTYANFMVRFTDEQFKPLAGLKSLPNYSSYTKAAKAVAETDLLPQFAEAYFKDKLKADKNNLLYYVLLSDVYMRNEKVIEARNTLSDALLIAPDNSLVRMKLIEVLIKEENRTQMLEELEKIKQDDPQSITVMDIKIKELFDNERYEDGAEELKKRIAIHGEDMSTDGYHILLLVNEKKYEELVKEAERLFKKYPDESKFVEMMYSIKKDVYKDKKGAMKVFESYMKDNFNYDMYESYASLQSEQGNNKKALEIKQNLVKSFPFNAYGYDELSKYYYGVKEFDKAEEYTRKSIALSPYHETYWEQLGDIKNELKRKDEALQAYNESLKFDPKQYNIIAKIRKLNGLPEINKLFKETDLEQAAKADVASEAKNTDYGYYYIVDEKNVVMHPGGATEEYIAFAIKITNEKGVDRYKESSIGYGNTQNLLIEKAEIIKKNNSHIQGERNGNEVVFTNLEVGDVVIFKYRLQNFSYGRFAKEFWDSYYFGGQIYTSNCRYSIMVPSGQKLQYKFTNSDIKPKQSKTENFDVYTWEVLKAEPLKDEPLMPYIIDAGTVLHVSTIQNWDEVANWYADISNNKAEDDFEIKQLYKKLFPSENAKTSQFQKARIIYDYLENNIRYSSVSFRQSAFVPQRPSATLSTRLGDCKDLSSLFVTLAQMAKIPAQLVLVSTRDNGENPMPLPAIEFNHCIVKANLDGKDYFVELTDNYLPFTSLPNNLCDASILEIPYRKTASGSSLAHLHPLNKTKDVVKRVMEIKPEGSNLLVQVKTIRKGSASSSIRYSYSHLDEERSMQDMEKSVASGYKNNVKLTKLAFQGLDKLEDSVSYDYSYTVKNEVSEIGSMSTFRIAYPDVVASLENFSAETRQFPIEYNSYEDMDQYETITTVLAPAGKKFVELPVTETLNFKNNKYSITYQLAAPDKLVVTRRFLTDRKQVSAADYPAFKDFFEKIVKAEQKFIAYK